MTFPRPTMLDLSRRTDVSRTEKGCPLLVMLEDEKGKGWYKWDWGTFIGLLETKQQHIIIHISMQGRRVIRADQVYHQHEAMIGLGLQVACPFQLMYRGSPILASAVSQCWEKAAHELDQLFQFHYGHSVPDICIIIMDYVSPVTALYSVWLEPSLEQQPRSLRASIKP